MVVVIMVRVMFVLLEVGLISRVFFGLINFFCFVWLIILMLMWFFIEVVGFIFFNLIIILVLYFFNRGMWLRWIRGVWLISFVILLVIFIGKGLLRREICLYFIMKNFIRGGVKELLEFNF